MLKKKGEQKPSCMTFLPQQYHHCPMPRLCRICQRRSSTIILWINVDTGFLQQQFHHHSVPRLCCIGQRNSSLVIPPAAGSPPLQQRSSSPIIPWSNVDTKFLQQQFHHRFMPRLCCIRQRSSFPNILWINVHAILLHQQLASCPDPAANDSGVLPVIPGESMFAPPFSSSSITVVASPCTVASDSWVLCCELRTTFASPRLTDQTEMKF